MKILLVDDDRILAAKLAKDLNSCLYAVDIAEDGETAFILASSAEYDLILLDVVLPKIDGITLCQKLRQKGCSTPIILLTVKDSKANIIEGLNAGADDYTIKPYDLQELLARINALMRRDRSPVISILSWGNLRLNPVLGEVSCGEQKIVLTPNEYRILELLLRNPQRTFRRSTIIDRVWTFDEPPTEKAVNTHIKDLRSKLKKGGVINDPIETVRGLGYRLKSPPINIVASEATNENDREFLERIIARYRKSLVEQLLVLLEAKKQLQQKTFDEELRHNAKQEAHKLAGSLGVFGYPEGSRFARAIELLFDGNRPLNPKEIVQLEKAIDNLQSELNKPPQTLESKPFAIHNANILVIDDDLLLGEKLKLEATVWGITIEIAKDLERAKKRLSNRLPDAILLSLEFPNVGEDGLIFLAKLKQEFPTLPIVFFTPSDDLTVRMTASELGVTKFINKTLPLAEIFRSIVQIVMRERVKENKLTIVSNDTALSSEIIKILSSYSIIVTIIPETPNLWDNLTVATPDILILDLDTLNYDGLEICRVVRQDAALGEIPILVLTESAEPKSMQKIFAAGADDPILKSDYRSELVDRVLLRLDRINR
jgi:DNA-binding response OmpR family regulator